MDKKERIACVCAPNDAAVNVHQSLISPDWAKNFNVLELNRDQLALLDWAGLWDDINANCGTFLDLYEEGRVEADGLEKLLECMDRARVKATDFPEASAPLERLRELVTAAQKRGVPVLFFL